MDRLLVERAKRRLTAKELAELSGVNAHTISDIERGIRKPRATTVARLAEALGLDPEELLGKEEAPNVSGGSKREEPIFDMVRDAILQQDRQDRQARARAEESDRPQSYFMRSENEVMSRLLDRHPEEVAAALIDAVREHVRLEQRLEQEGARLSDNHIAIAERK